MHFWEVFCILFPEDEPECLIYLPLPSLQILSFMITIVFILIRLQECHKKE